LDTAEIIADKLQRDIPFLRRSAIFGSDLKPAQYDDEQGYWPLNYKRF